jgi:hypothetical protein
LLGRVLLLYSADRKTCGDALTARVGYFVSPNDFSATGSPCILYVQKSDIASAGIMAGKRRRRKRQVAGLAGMRSTICQFRQSSK